ncbi:MAG TPA: cupin domain-containing protein [Terriglobales bacterium]
MRFGHIGPLLIVGFLLVASLASAQDPNQMSYAGIKESKFMNLPVLPSCMTISPQRGDPMKEKAVILAKATTGCQVPWHWHSVSESLMIVSGRGKAEMKDGGSHTVTTGDFLYLPAKQTHQFTCTANCVFFISTDGAFDIHYVDKDGKEVPPEQVLKQSPKAGMKKPTTK